MQTNKSCVTHIRAARSPLIRAAACIWPDNGDWPLGQAAARECQEERLASGLARLLAAPERRSRFFHPSRRARTKRSLK